MNGFKTVRNENGFTMVEVVMAIVVMSIALPPLMQMFSETSVTAARVDRLPAASSLGNELMEEVKSRKFDELDEEVNDNWSTTLGPDGTEGTNKANYDDVDDFNGWSQTFSAPFTDYSATVSVSYVASNNLNTPLAIPAPTPNGWTPSYKRIVVTVSNASLAANTSVTTVVTEVHSL